MTNNPKISVIIPFFNAEAFIKKAINSVVNQKSVGEILLINDNSKDSSIEIINGLREKYPLIKLISHKYPYNVGAGKARNIGIKEARFDLLAFLDVDDYYYPNRFENALEILLNNPDADGVYEAVENVFENKNAKLRFNDGRPFEENNLYTLKKVVGPKELFKTLMIGNAGFFHFNGVLIKKELFEKVGYLDESLELTQDTDVFFKMAMIGSLYPGNLTNAVAARLVHDSNRIFQNQSKLKYFRIKKYFGLEQFARKRKLDKQRLWITKEKNVKIFADEMLHWNIYRMYRLKFTIIFVLYPIIVPIFLSINRKKYNSLKND